jgi:hypothetical protein
MNQGNLSQVQNHFTFIAMSVLKKVNIDESGSFCVLHLDASVYKSLRCTCACLPTTACAAPVHVCLQQPVLHLHVSVYKSLCCTGHFSLQVPKLLGCKQKKNTFWFYETIRKTTETD